LVCARRNGASSKSNGASSKSNEVSNMDRIESGKHMGRRYYEM
jgi:hypothetical protein